MRSPCGSAISQPETFGKCVCSVWNATGLHGLTVGALPAGERSRHALHGLRHVIRRCRRCLAYVACFRGLGQLLSGLRSRFRLLFSLGLSACRTDNAITATMTKK